MGTWVAEWLMSLTITHLSYALMLFTRCRIFPRSVGYVSSTPVKGYGPLPLLFEGEVDLNPCDGYDSYICPGYSLVGMI